MDFDYFWDISINKFVSGIINVDCAERTAYLGINKRKWLPPTLALGKLTRTWDRQLSVNLSFGSARRIATIICTGRAVKRYDGYRISVSANVEMWTAILHDQPIIKKM
ncbi:MAG: hypothetical protein JST09_02825 [Bacteroidetes bacterium]|nr:hypothetical protein [Bacteroidota bacterium]